MIFNRKILGWLKATKEKISDAGAADEISQEIFKMAKGHKKFICGKGTDEISQENFNVKRNVRSSG